MQQTSAQSELEGAAGAAAAEGGSEKKPFVEPAVSLPQDVIEATAFFQGSAALDIADL